MSRWADKLDVLSAAATKDPEGFLGHPVNALKLIKRFNREWAELENLVLTDMSDGDYMVFDLSCNVPRLLSETPDCSSVSVCPSAALQCSSLTSPSRGSTSLTMTTRLALPKP